MLPSSEMSRGNVAVELNHTIVAAQDARATATFLAELLGLPAPTRFGPFHVVSLDNGVSLDVLETADGIATQHYAFLVGEPDFDAIFARIQDWGLPFWADPGKRQHGEINHNDGGRGVYFPDPNDHLLEIITVPYGG